MAPDWVCVSESLHKDKCRHPGRPETGFCRSLRFCAQGTSLRPCRPRRTHDLTSVPPTQAPVTWWPEGRQPPRRLLGETEA